jgi:hypothetical protein
MLDRKPPPTFAGGDPERGRQRFSIHLNHCAICHILPRGSDNNVDDRRLVDAGDHVKTPPLATVYQRAFFNPQPGQASITGFGLGHDGTGSVLPNVHFYELDELTGADFSDVAAFVLCFDTGTAPAVGYSRTVTADSAAAALAEIAVLEAQAGLANCDLAVQGRLGGRSTGFRFDTFAESYRGDRRSGGLMSRGQLVAALGPGDVLTFIGLPQGSGFRRGGDRDGDGILDGDEAPPDFDFARHPIGARLSWPAFFPDWLPEHSPRVEPPWHPMTERRSRQAGVNWIDIPAASGAGFYRFRRTW